MVWCMSCAQDVAPVATMNGAAQIVQSCPTCETPIGGKAMTRPLADYDRSKERPMAVASPKPDPDPVVVPFPKRPSPAHAAPEPTVAATGDVIGMIRARLTFLDAEIAKRAGMEVEAKRLRKMLSAADRATAPKGEP